MTGEAGCRLVDDDGTFVHARLGQVLNGLVVGSSGERAACIACGRDFDADDDIVAYVYWSEDAIDWTIGRPYCADCGPDVMPVPTLGLTEAIVSGELSVREFPGAGSRWLCLSEVRPDRTSPPTEGAEP